jgi:hypothetical protein
MTERQALLDFPGAEALRAAGRIEPPSARALERALAAVEVAARAEAEGAALRRGVQQDVRLGGRPGGPTGARPGVRRDVGQDVRLGGRPGTALAPLWQRRRVLAVVAVAAVAAGAVVTCANTGATPVSGRHATQAQSASVLLNDVSEVAATRSAGSGKYWKMQTRTGTSYVSRSMDLTYVVAGRTVRQGHFHGWQLGTKVLDWNGLDRLSTDPTVLRRLLLSTKKGPWEEDAGTVAFEDATTVLANAPAGPELRAGLFKALAGLKGVTDVGTVRDAAGRTGTKLVHRGGVGITSVIIDPKTSTLLELDTPWKSEKDDRTVTILSAGRTDTAGGGTAWND